MAFSKTSSSEWKQKILDELKGADFEETLVWESPEGIKVQPFYHSDDLKSSRKLSQGKRDGWKICQSIYVNEAKEANRKAHDALSRGSESFFFNIPSKDIPLENLLRGIDQETVPIYFDFRFLSFSYLKKVQGKVKNAYLNLDCIGHLARTGNWFFDEEKDFEISKSLQGQNNKNILSVDVSLYQNAGANIVQQLAYALAHTNEYFTRRVVNSPISFKISVGTNYFFEIAKLRALRLLFGILAEEYDLIGDCHIITEPTKRNKTIYDYNSNMLRTTTESMAAILGGADAVCNLPYDSIYHEPNEFAERIARNQLVILKDESYFSKVYNPAAGSYYIESLTQELAEEALKMFKEIEGKGGFLKLLKAGIIQEQITESARVEQEKFDKKEIVIVGSNVFQNAEDRMKDNLDIDSFQKEEPMEMAVEPIFERRLTSSMEQKRLNDE